MATRRLAADTSNDDNTNARDAEYVDVEGGLATADLADDERDFEDEVLSEIDSEADRAIFTLKVYRVGKGVKDQEYCATYSVADFPLIDKIAMDHGGGKYHVMIYKGPRLFRRRHITISATVKPQSALVATPSAEGGAIMAAIAALQQVAKDSAAKPQTSALQIVAAFAPFAPVITAVVNNWRQPDPMAQMTSMVALLKGMKDLSSDDSGSDREKSPFELVADVLTKSPLVAGLLPQPPQQPQPAQLPPPQRPTVVTPEQAQAAMLSQFREQLRMLIGRAQANSPPELYADLLDDMLPDDLKQLLKQPGSYQFLENIEPAIATYRPWFEAVLQAFRSPPMDDEEEEPPHQNGVDTGGGPVAGVNDAHSTPVAPHLSRIVAGWQGGDTHDASGDGEDRS